MCIGCVVRQIDFLRDLKHGGICSCSQVWLYSITVETVPSLGYCIRLYPFSPSWEWLQIQASYLSRAICFIFLPTYAFVLLSHCLSWNLITNSLASSSVVSHSSEADWIRPSSIGGYRLCLCSQLLPDTNEIDIDLCDLHLILSGKK